MRLLLDTHVVLWAWEEPDRLPRPIRDEISALSNDCCVSVATVWEIATKQGTGKLKLPAAAEEWVPEALARFRFTLLDITMRHALHAGRLPRIHGDPFDRMLIAQARAENLTLVTADAVFPRYDAPVRLV